MSGDLGGHDGGGTASARSVKAGDPFLAILRDAAEDAVFGDSESPDDWDIVGKGWGSGQGATGDYRTAWEASAPAHIANSELTAVARATAYQDVLDNAGAFPRDAVDARVVQDVIDEDTGIIDSQSEVGGWPELLPNYPQGGVAVAGAVVRRVGKVLGGMI